MSVQVSRVSPNNQLGRGCAQLRGTVICRAVKRARRQRGEEDPNSERAARRRAVLKYARECQASEVQAWIEQQPPKVVSAMKLTVNNLVGTLPPQHFSVTIDTVAESLVTLMETMLRTGYLLRGAQYQLELETALQGAAASMSAPPAPPAPSTLPPVSATSSSSAERPPSPDRTFIPEVVNGGTAGAARPGMTAGAWAHTDDCYAPGVQLSRVQGDVLRWHHAQGLERLPAKEYILALEEQVRALQLQVEQQQQQLQQLGVSPLISTPGLAPLAGPSPASLLPVATTTESALPSNLSLALGTTAGAEAMSGSTPALAAAAVAAAAAGCSIAASGDGLPDLLSYLRGLDTTSLAALGACGGDVADAMQFFIERLMGAGMSDRESLRSMTSTFDMVELSKLLFWLLVVGWSLRSLEVRYDVEEGFGSAPTAAPQDDKPDGWMLPGW